MSDEYLSLQHIPSFPPSSGTTKRSSMSFSALLQGCQDNELDVRLFEKNTISGLDPTSGFSSISVQSAGLSGEAVPWNQYNRETWGDDAAMAALVPGMFRHAAGGWKRLDADPHLSEWIAVSVDPIWALFCAAWRLGLGHQQQVFMSIIRMPGDHDPENPLIVVNPLQEAKKAGLDTTRAELFSLDPNKLRLAKNCLAKFGTELVYRRIPIEYIVETVELTHNSIPWDDIPLGWFRGGADPSSQSHYGWLYCLSFDPFSKDTHYGDAQIAILDEKRSIEKAKEEEESQWDSQREFQEVDTESSTGDEDGVDLGEHEDAFQEVGLDGVVEEEEDDEGEGEASEALVKTEDGKPHVAVKHEHPEEEDEDGESKGVKREKFLNY
ncbi:hypothetical protein L198_07147 [Cryptococcus wingfieldii CBS 7118]|uniref:Uncharacterized protein n=1 Tax=Cryptococcus wingfieldii CBS 7118 TaxID=1295528 RepID=A0A1E3IEV1_9TREE|nr:hypothetical protein L198_07147 [Cryptococcus wingfieldii CBS 7118]ODN87144.1 hypothetical protein L198_07147 [Cryptococcus wingfieldii CBS 7118]